MDRHLFVSVNPFHARHVREPMGEQSRAPVDGGVRAPSLAPRREKEIPYSKKEIPYSKGKSLIRKGKRLIRKGKSLIRKGNPWSAVGGVRSRRQLLV